MDIESLMHAIPSKNHFPLQFYLESCLTELRKDLVTLQQLETPHLVAVVGVQYCPPSLALEAAPFGSLRSWMRRLRRKMRRVDTHYIALQVHRMHQHQTPPVIDSFSFGLCLVTTALECSGFLSWTEKQLSLYRL